MEDIFSSGIINSGFFKPSFSILSLPGIKFWGKADTGLYQNSNGTTAASSDGDPVGYWTDLSGNSNHFTQGTSSNRPSYKTNRINSRPSVYFTVDDYLQASTMFMAAPTAWTIYIVRVARIGSGGALVGAFSYDVIGGWQFSSDGRVASVNDGVGTRTWNTGAFGDPVWRYFTSKFDGSNIPTRINGTQTGSQSNTGSYTGMSPQIQVSIGALLDNGLFPPTLNNVLEGEIAELIMCDQAHSAANITLTETYLAARYAL